MRFTDFGSRTLLAAFDGGEITSNAGVLLLRERAEQINLFDRMAACFTDHRDPLRIKHQLPTLLSQRVCGMALGYEDINDHDTLRNDPAIKLLASSCLTLKDKTPAPLAGKSTLNRLEHSREAGNPRYHQMVPNLKKLSNLFTDIFLDSHETVHKEITLDIDATDIKAHGHQENSFFHGYYEERCFLPLYIFCGHYLLLAQLRPSNIDGARGSRNVIRRIIRMIKTRWPKVKILVRRDSGFVRENLIKWCENNSINYVFGLARNNNLLKKAQKVRGKAAKGMIDTNEPTRAYGDFYHRTKSESWAWPRRVIVKAEHRPGKKPQCRFLVNSLTRKTATPKEVYKDIYCPRGDMENRIKDCQLDLFGDRMSAHDYRANQLRLIMAGFAYVLIDGIRREALQGTKLAKAVPNTIRLKLLKVGARVIYSVRRIKISMPDAYPYQNIFFKVHAALAPT
ncbi:IS1380 family transposase [Paremcibacter congregatus]|uniref:IS1380 family transposase n=1 Tax=Paremcibacter congregatus TaxID=2043170 RepID=A0A2G4YVJ9_9PROT|nr:IS1380 family transposase [Paremcibacter congregatus]PHZ84794.1 IS1380 family transposase [Paremcibacter congregatus]PHZ86358.1 IS1380 family transposase [Paremcibacter congregatus]QDE26228.1 IS1380 family transposase [Paremcibacter congregatus]QDE27996.1 IS1380 family transposase [Paremcibacter congregatus]